MAMKFPMPSKGEIEMPEDSMEGMTAEGEMPAEESPVDLAAVSDELLIEELKNRGFEIEEG
jgi:hypothetical protein